MPLAEEENTPSASNSSRPRTAAPPVETNAASNPATAAEARVPNKTLVARFRAALDEPVTDKRREAWRRALAAAGPAELEAAARLLLAAKDPPRMGDWLPELLMHRWQSADPAGYLRFVMEHPDARIEDESFKRMAGTRLAKNDPAALQAVLENSAAALGDSALEGVVAGMASGDLERAVDWVLAAGDTGDWPIMRTLGSGAARGAGMDGAGRLLTILRRKQNLPAKQLEVAMHGALTMLAEMPDPDIPAAAAWLRSQQSQPGWPADSLPVFFRSMAYHHPAQVMETVQAMGPDSATGRWPHAADAMGELAKTTAFNALYWLRKNPESPLYDEAALAWTKHVSASLEFTDVYLMKADGVAAIHANIKDPAMRTAAGEIYATARAAKDNKK
jgi:hypothetical protein